MLHNEDDMKRTYETQVKSVSLKFQQWGAGNAAPVATATFYVLKDNKAEKIP
jgi:hypothetical protein